jgi:hypothetical protein
MVVGLVLVVSAPPLLIFCHNTPAQLEGIHITVPCCNFQIEQSRSG